MVAGMLRSHHHQHHHQLTIIVVIIAVMAVGDIKDAREASKLQCDRLHD